MDQLCRLDRCAPIFGQPPHAPCDRRCRQR
jgi:hypothetical protein